MDEILASIRQLIGGGAATEKEESFHTGSKVSSALDILQELNVEEDQYRSTSDDNNDDGIHLKAQTQTDRSDIVDVTENHTSNLPEDKFEHKWNEIHHELDGKSNRQDAEEREAKSSLSEDGSDHYISELEDEPVPHFDVSDAENPINKLQKMMFGRLSENENQEEKAQLAAGTSELDHDQSAQDDNQIELASSVKTEENLGDDVHSENANLENLDTTQDNGGNDNLTENSGNDESLAKAQSGVKQQTKQEDLVEAIAQDTKEKLNEKNEVGRFAEVLGFEQREGVSDTQHDGNTDLRIEQQTMINDKNLDESSENDHNEETSFVAEQGLQQTSDDNNKLIVSQENDSKNSEDDPEISDSREVNEGENKMNSAERIISTQAEVDIRESFRQLSALKMGNAEDRTLEDLVTELMRPMINSWLSQNLPSIVDKAVKEEITRLTR